MDTLLSVKKIKKIYGRKNNLYVAIENISFDISAGEFVGIMGPSGAGKTSLLNMIASIDRPTTGEILIEGTDITKMSERRRALFRRNSLGFVFQEYHLIDSLTVQDNILLPLAINRTRNEEIFERLKKIGKILGIEYLLSHYPFMLSVGQKQRVAVARAMITQPKLLLADEPTGALDSKAATELLRYFSYLNETEHATILMVTHDAFTASYCKRILFIKDGQIFSELRRNDSRKKFFKQIIQMQATLGGGLADIYD